MADYTVRFEVHGWMPDEDATGEDAVVQHAIDGIRPDDVLDMSVVLTDDRRIPVPTEDDR